VFGFLAPFVDHWGYAALFATILIGSVGVPVPEETILTLAGYLVWRGDLRLPLVLIVGVVGASLGDNLGYWLGRRVGSDTLRRYGARVRLDPATLEATERFVRTHGPAAIFVARFIPGLRFAAGPVSGISGVRADTFFIANVLGALCYVPIVVGVGYAIGRGAGPRLERALTAGVAVEHIVLVAALIGTVGALWLRARRPKS
jgi:membrane protein DedA with SNARE-associated domain